MVPEAPGQDRERLPRLPAELFRQGPGDEGGPDQGRRLRPVPDESEAPELDFLEYLGSWEESDEDWVVLAPDAAVNEESDEEKEEVDTAPNGEKLAELDDE